MEYISDGFIFLVLNEKEVEVEVDEVRDFDSILLFLCLIRKFWVLDIIVFVLGIVWNFVLFILIFLFMLFYVLRNNLEIRKWEEVIFYFLWVEVLNNVLKRINCL